MTHSPLAAVLHFLWCPATRLWFHSQISVAFSTRDNNNNVIHSCGPSSGGGNDTSQSSIADQHSDTLLGEKAAAHHHHHPHLFIHHLLWRRESSDDDNRPQHHPKKAETIRQQKFISKSSLFLPWCMGERVWILCAICVNHHPPTNIRTLITFSATPPLHHTPMHSRTVEATTWRGAIKLQVTRGTRLRVSPHRILYCYWQLS